MLRAVQVLLLVVLVLLAGGRSVVEGASPSPESSPSMSRSSTVSPSQKSLCEASCGLWPCVLKFAGTSNATATCRDPCLDKPCSAFYSCESDRTKFANAQCVCGPPLQCNGTVTGCNGQDVKAKLCSYRGFCEDTEADAEFAVSSRRCHCDRGFSGHNCFDRFDCTTTPCLRGGQCLNSGSEDNNSSVGLCLCENKQGKNIGTGSRCMTSQSMAEYIERVEKQYEEEENKRSSEKNEEDKVDTAKVVLIVICSICGVALIAATVFIIFLHRKRKGEGTGNQVQTTRDQIIHINREKSIAQFRKAERQANGEATSDGEGAEKGVCDRVRVTTAPLAGYTQDKKYYHHPSSEEEEHNVPVGAHGKARTGTKQQAYCGSSSSSSSSSASSESGDDDDYSVSRDKDRHGNTLMTPPLAHRVSIKTPPMAFADDDTVERNQFATRRLQQHSSPALHKNRRATTGSLPSVEKKKKKKRTPPVLVIPKFMAATPTPSPGTVLELLEGSNSHTHIENAAHDVRRAQSLAPPVRLLPPLKQVLFSVNIQTEHENEEHGEGEASDSAMSIADMSSGSELEVP